MGMRIVAVPDRQGTGTSPALSSPSDLLTRDRGKNEEEEEAGAG